MDLALKDWNSMFTESTKFTWMSERAELKKAAMLVHALAAELTSIKRTADTEMRKYHAMFKEIDELKCNRDVSTKKSLKLDITPLSNNSNKTTTSKLDSPDLFNCDSSPNPSPSSSTTILITDDDISVHSQNLQESPKINRNSAYLKQKRDRLREGKKLNLSNEKSPVKKNYKQSQLDYVIEATPDPKKIKKSSRFIKKKALKDTTLTQMLSTSPSTSKLEIRDDDLMSLDAVLDLINDKHPTDNNKIDNIDKSPDRQSKSMHNKFNENDKKFGENYKLDDFIKNYDKLPDRQSNKSINNKINRNVLVDRNCKKCEELETKCRDHRVPPVTRMDKTYTGFWDIGFDDDTIRDNINTEKSTIFL